MHGVKAFHISLNCAVNSMVQIRRFKRRFNIENKLHYYPAIFAIQSEVSAGTVYCISDGKFAVLRCDGAVYCPIGEYRELADKMKPDIKQEILSTMEMWGGGHEAMQGL